MYKSKRTIELLNFRTSSPNPIHSPSPDFATTNIIVPTKIPNPKQISNRLNLSYSTKQAKNLNQQLLELTKQNNLLKNQIEKLKYNQKKSYIINESVDTSRLIVQKDQQINNLKSQLKQLSTTRLSTTSRKLNLAKSLIPNVNQLQNKLSEVLEENQQLKKLYNPDQIKRIKKNIDQLQEQNNNLRNMISHSRFKQELMRNSENSQRSQLEFQQHNNQIKQLQNRFQKSVQIIQNQTSDKLNKKIVQLEKKLDQLQQKYLSKLNSIISSEKKNYEATSSGFKKLLENSPMARGDSGKIHEDQDQIQEIHSFAPKNIQKQQKLIPEIKIFKGNKNIEQIGKGELKNCYKKGLSLSNQKKDTIENLQKQNERYLSRISQLEVRFNEQKIKYEKLINNLQSRLNSQKNTLKQDIPIENQFLDTQKNTLLFKQNIDDDKKSKVYQQQLQINRITIDSLRRQNNQLSSRLKFLDSQLNQCKKKLEEKSMTQNDFNMMKIRMNELENIIYEKNNTYYNMETKYQILNQRYESQLDKIQQILKQKNSQIQKLQNELYNKKGEQQEQFDKNRGWNKIQLENLDMDLINIKQIIKSIDLNNVQQDLRYTVNRNIHIAKLKIKQIQNLKKLIESLNTEIIQLKEQNINLIQANNDNFSKINQLSNNIQKLENQCEQYRIIINQFINTKQDKDDETEVDLEQYQYNTKNLQDVKIKVAKAIQKLDNLNLKLQLQNKK